MVLTKKRTERLAILGGPKAVTLEEGDMFTWPIITQEDEEAVLEVLRHGGMSGTDVTEQFEREFADWHGMKYALGFCNGTASLHTAMWACGVGRGDEIIAPSLTYWATCLPALNLGATVVFAEVLRDTLCLDPEDVERRITPRTKAIIPVHYAGYPAEMGPLMQIAERHGIKVIEDASHAHGGLYRGRLIGTMGHVACFSCMSLKSLAIGEAGVYITNDREIYERGVAFAHYERHESALTLPQLVKDKGLPFGGLKYRMHQLSSAMGRVQLKHYRQRMEEIQTAMNYFWDLLEGAPGLKAHRPPRDSGSTMGGWYSSRGLYHPEELGGLPVATFVEAVVAEGAFSRPGTNAPLHPHPVLNTVDVYGDGKPTRLAFSNRDVRQPAGSLPITESIPERVMRIPWFKRFRPELIEQHAAAFRKVAENAGALLQR